VDACIVGHGPSLLKHEWGDTIDSHDTVIRLKRSKTLLEKPRVYGTRTHIVMGSLVIAPAMVREWDVREYWFFLDTRTKALCNQAIAAFRQTVPVLTLIDRELCLDLIKDYQELRQSIELDSRQKPKGPESNAGKVNLSDDKGHLHPSAGMFAVAYTLRHVKPDMLRLYGFDNVLKGFFDWSVTRGPDWKDYPDHNWKAESLLLGKLAKQYGYSKMDNAEVVTLCKSDM